MHNESIINLTNMHNGEFRFVRVGKDIREELIVFIYDDLIKEEKQYIVIAKLDKPMKKVDQKAAAWRLTDVLNSYKRGLNNEYSTHEFQFLLDSLISKKAKFTKEGYDLLNHKHLFNDHILKRTVFVEIDPESHNKYGALNNSHDDSLFKPLDTFNDLELTSFEIGLSNLKGYLRYHFEKVKDFCIKEKDGPRSYVYDMLIEYMQKRRVFVRSLQDAQARKSAEMVQEKLLDEVLMILDANYERRINERLNDEQVK